MAATLTTYGLAAPIAATGAAVATAGSLTTLGVSVADYIAKKGIEYQWKEFKKQFSSLAELPEVDATDIKMDELTCTLEEQKRA
ncbi:hypothetical protein BaRGS_00028220 [Batillaria attramentaria]|uniref:SMODS and SLOG-associating 2TM effector domain-containing protein n=1 Tax=Batillaria attramentaria TaxID=370345 RepID=A0ABD0K068_9CAEN